MATVIFDGNDHSPDMKDAAHLRRTHGSGPTVHLTPETVVSLKKDFLSNNAQKHRFLNIRSNCAWNIRRSKEKLGQATCSRLLFAHGVLGCDTTSRVYGIGKPVALAKINSSPVSTIVVVLLVLPS